jgi:adenylate cyclase
VTPTRRLAAIMFTDLVGYTSLAQSDEPAALRLLKESEDLVRPLFRIHQGREIKSTGDGVLVEFSSALRAVQCATDIHQRLRQRNSKKGAAPIVLRIGVHLGDVEERGGDIFGDAVNLASRIEPLAPPGGICISGPVFDQVRNKISNRIEKLGPKKLRNIEFATEVYRIVLPWDSSPSTRAESAIPTRLAVLPLVNISPDPKDEYFADGLTEELTCALSKLRDLRVIARTSVGQYKSTSKPVSQIGAELGVGSILEGSVRKFENRLRITLQLIDVNSEEHLWAESYDRQLSDVFALQTEIAERTAGALQLELVGPERESIRAKPTSNLLAYDLYLKGIHAARQSTPEGFKESVRCLEEAIRLDPNFSQACAFLANTYLFLSGDTLPPGESFPRAKVLVAKALELDSGSSDAHTARGNLALQYEHDWGLAEAEFRRAISLNSSNANAHFWYGILLYVVRRFAEAQEAFRTAVELEPLWKNPRAWLILLHQDSGDFRSAIELVEEERAREPQNPSHHVRLGTLFIQTGRREDARAEAELSNGPLSRYEELDRAYLWKALGNPDEARRLTREWIEAGRMEHIPATLIAGLYAVSGDREKAFYWLDRDFRTGAGAFWLDYQSIAFESIRKDPKFLSLIERLHLPAASKRLATHTAPPKASAPRNVSRHRTARKSGTKTRGRV